MVERKPSRLPLLFAYRDTLFGPGVLIEVRVFNGRALYVEEADGGWLYGVNPGGMAAPGASLQEAHQAFRQAFSNVLVDLILETKSEDEYRTVVERFVHETNDAYEAEWRAAVEAVRALPSNPTGLAKAPADSPLRVEVLAREQSQVTDNVAQSDTLLAA
jgi:hypothetical protein